MASALSIFLVRHYKVPANLKKLIKFGKVPTIDFETEVREVIGKGTGPGGQKVNTAKNAVVLIHIDSKVFVRCHESRSLEKNRTIARERLIDKLDLHLNGEDSIESQVEKIKKERALIKKEKAKARLEAKHAAKQISADDQEQNEPGSVCPSTQSNDGKDGVENPTGRL